MTAQLEKVAVNATALEPEHIHPNRCEHRFQCISRPHEIGVPWLPIRSRQRPSIDLPFRSKRHRVEENEHCRHHMVGQGSAQVFAQFLVRIARRYNVSGEELHCGLTVRDDRYLLYGWVPKAALTQSLQSRREIRAASLDRRCGLRNRSHHPIGSSRSIQAESVGRDPEWHHGFGNALVSSRLADYPCLLDQNRSGCADQCWGKRPRAGSFRLQDGGQG
jgi:hypothetical protein